MGLSTRTRRRRVERRRTSPALAAAVVPGDGKRVEAKGTVQDPAYGYGADRPTAPVPGPQPPAAEANGPAGGRGQARRGRGQFRQQRQHPGPFAQDLQERFEKQFATRENEEAELARKNPFELKKVDARDGPARPELAARDKAKEEKDIVRDQDEVRRALIWQRNMDRLATSRGPGGWQGRVRSGDGDADGGARVRPRPPRREFGRASHRLRGDALLAPGAWSCRTARRTYRSTCAIRRRPSRVAQSAVFASAVAAISVTRHGAQSSMPTSAEVQTFLSERLGTAALPFVETNA